MVRHKKIFKSPEEVVKSYQQEISYQKEYKIHKETQIICLGLGNFELRAPKYQLAFILEICDNLKVTIYDPIWKDTDFQLLENYPNLEYSPTKSFKVTSKTLFVMFHCPHELLDQVVESNLDNLDLITILCNDLADYRNDTKYLNLANVSNRKTLVKTRFELERFHSNVFTGSFWHTWDCDLDNELLSSLENIKKIDA